jgi:hypothetical protein
VKIFWIPLRRPFTIQAPTARAVREGKEAISKKHNKHLTGMKNQHFQTGSRTRYHEPFPTLPDFQPKSEKR